MNTHPPQPDEDPAPSDRASGRPEDAAGSPSANPVASAPEPPPLHPPVDPAGTGTLPPQAGAPPESFFGWIRSHGIYRGRERWIGGVASGIAQRLGVDPLIVRGVLIVLAIFAGIGVLLYGLAWALLPEPDGRIHVQEAAAGRWTAGMTGSLITTLIGFPGLGAGVWGWDRHGVGGFVWTVFWVGGTIYLVYYLTQRNKAGDGTAPTSWRSQSGGPVNAAAAAGTAHPTGPAGGFPGRAFAQDTAPAYGQPAQDPAGYGGKLNLTKSTAPSTGPAWGPSGPTPPPGGYYPVPGGTPAPPAQPRNPGPGAPAVAVTLGLALLVGGGIKALDAANVVELGSSGTAVVWASGAAVLGLGILFAGLRGRTSGILGFFAVVALLIGAIFNVVPNGDRFRFQNADWAPATIEQARNGFDITGGSGTADLTRLALNPPLGADLVVPIDATASDLTVVIPDAVPVQVQADMTMGNLQEGSQNRGGMTTQRSDYNTGKPGARLVLQVSATASNVTIKEGN
ncbi:MAG: PspC protein [Arthrobacter sp.]|jgi:phage shock protein PspC (stress-responsive transcriptional regulator)|nr:PspC protein [Arthrobacter sp.]